MEKHYHISDCTLRDAGNAPGIKFSEEQTIAICKRLDQLNIDEIEVCSLDILSDRDAHVTELSALNLNTPLCAVLFCTSTKSIREGIRKAKQLNIQRLMISIPSSETFRKIKLNRSFRASCSLLKKAVSEAKAEGLYVIFSGEDAARSSDQELLDYVDVGVQAGADRFRFAESVACLEPSMVSDKIGKLNEKLSIPIEIHCHSAHGLGVANTLAALNNGSTWASVTIAGIGERGGNTNLETIMLYLTKFKDQHHFNLEPIKSLADYVSHAADLPFHRLTSIVGDDCFSYELMSQFANSSSYEDYPPSLVGGERDIIFGFKRDVDVLKGMIRKYVNGDENAYLLPILEEIERNDIFLKHSEIEKMIAKNISD